MRRTRRLPWMAAVRLCWAVTVVVAASAPSAVAQTASPGADPALAPYDAAARAYAQARSVQARFEQTLTNPNTRTTVSSSGRFAQRGTRRFDFRFESPPGERILSDGTALWVYIPSTLKGQVLRLPMGMAGGLDVVGALLQPAGERFVVRADGRDTVAGRPARRFVLAARPGTAAPFASATAWIDAARPRLLQFEVTEPSGLVRRVRFSAIRLDAALPDDAFVFTVPAGVRVVDQSALMGGSVRPD